MSTSMKKKISAKWGLGNVRSSNCFSRDVTIQKSLAICTLPSEPSKHISIACSCVSESRAESSGSSSRLYFIGGNYGRRDSKPPRRPSEREQFIIQRVAEGCKNREIADSLGTTEHVVKNYLRLIYDKLGLWNRVELALWYEARQHEQVYNA